MSTARRVMWEGIILVVLVVAAAGAYKVMERGWRQQILDEHQRSVAELAAFRNGAAELGESMARRQTEAVLRAFAAGVQPSLLAGKDDAVDTALGQLLELDGVVFVHVLRPDGSVVATSDRKLMTTGEAGARGRWALQAPGFAMRDGKVAGTTEAVLPMPTVADGRVIVWLAYDTSRLISESTSSEAVAEAATGSADGAAP
jgi:hypothetical protein